MRVVSLVLACLVLPGCGLEPTGALAAANAASVVVFQRGIPDIVISAVSGKDCSVVHLEQGKDYCTAPEAAPSPPPYCTRSLGVVDCWSNPEALVNRPREVADGARALTPAQEANRTRRWGGF
jgi:hypothetical protein